MERFVPIGVEFERMNIQYRVVHHAAVTTIPDVVAVLGLPEAVMVKVLLFNMGQQDRYLVAAIRGNDRVDRKKLAKAVGASRGDLSFVDPAQVETVTGTPLGAMRPYGYDERFTVIFDRLVLDNRVVFCSAGTKTDTLIIKADDLFKISRGKVNSITQAKVGKTTRA